MKRIAIFQSDLRVGGIQKALVNILNELDYSRCAVDVYLFDRECFFELPRHENLTIRFLPPMPPFVRLLYFGLALAVTGDVTGGKEYDVSICCVNVNNCEMSAILPVHDGGVVYFFSTATGRSALWAR